jgi:hypothetical protein
MKYANWKEWLFDTIIRAVKTMVESSIAVIITASVIWDVDWKLVLGTALLSFVVTFLMNVKNLPNPFEPKNDTDGKASTEERVDNTIGEAKVQLPNQPAKIEKGE